MSSTIHEWINEQSRSPYRTNLFYKNGYLIMHKMKDQPEDVIRIPFYHIFIQNRELFDNIKIRQNFNPKYFYQPKKMSMELYGTTQLWHILLILNKCRSTVDFKGFKCYILDPNQVMEYMSRMFVDEDVNTTIYTS